MPYDQYVAWASYFAEEPFGEERADLRAGIIASTIINANPYRKKGSKVVTPADVMPSLRPAGSERARDQYGRVTPMSAEKFSGVVTTARAYAKGGAFTAK